MGRKRMPVWKIKMEEMSGKTGKQGWAYSWPQGTWVTGGGAKEE